MDPVDETGAKTGGLGIWGVLLLEHERILPLSDSFEVYGQMLRMGQADPADLIKFCVCFRELGALIQHEEQLLASGGPPSGFGAQAGILPEFEAPEQEHALLLHMMRCALKELPWEDPDRERITSLAAGYAVVLRARITDKRDRLFPELEDSLSGEDLSELEHGLSRFDQALRLSDQMTWLLDLAASLEQKYPAR
ncbi:MAG TPA: hypothetical protein VN764_02195 [Polyangiaceae bacterium]|nr:hypothetical protein [Polyangiaceae bacterium]